MEDNLSLTDGIRVLVHLIDADRINDLLVVDQLTLRCVRCQSFLCIKDMHMMNLVVQHIQNCKG